MAKKQEARESQASEQEAAAPASSQASEQEAAAPASSVKLVRMQKLDPETLEPVDFYADVHPDEVENYKAGNFIVAE